MADLSRSNDPKPQYGRSDFLGRRNRRRGDPIFKLSRTTWIAVGVGALIAFCLPMLADLLPSVQPPGVLVRDAAGVLGFTVVVAGVILLVRYRIERRQALGIEPASHRFLRAILRAMEICARGLFIYVILSAVLWVMLLMASGPSDIAGLTATAFFLAVPISVMYGLWRRYDRRRGHEPSRRMAARANTSMLTRYQRQALARHWDLPRASRVQFALALHFVTFFVIVEFQWLIGATVNGAAASPTGGLALALLFAGISIRVCGLYYQRGLPEEAGQFVIPARRQPTPEQRRRQNQRTIGSLTGLALIIAGYVAVHTSWVQSRAWAGSAILLLSCVTTGALFVVFWRARRD